MGNKVRFSGMRITAHGNKLVGEYVENRITQGGVFSPIASSIQMGETYEASV